MVPSSKGSARRWVLLCAILISSPAFASEGGHEGVPWSFLAWHAVNLTILVAAIAWFVRRPLKDALANRTLTVRRAIEDAQRARDAAEKRHNELHAQLADFQVEVEKMRAEVRVEAEREREHILEQAEREAALIVASAERAIRDETLRARRSLQQEAVELAVKLAEEALRQHVNANDQAQLAGDLLSSIRAQGEAHGR